MTNNINPVKPDIKKCVFCRIISGFYIFEYFRQFFFVLSQTLV